MFSEAKVEHLLVKIDSHIQKLQAASAVLIYLFIYLFFVSHLLLTWQVVHTELRGVSFLSKQKKGIKNT
jgi:hypothetical protein